MPLADQIEAGRAEGRDLPVFTEELLLSLEERISALEAAAASTSTKTTAKAAAALPPVPTV